MGKLVLVAILTLLMGCAHIQDDPRCHAVDPGDDRTPDELGCVEHGGRWVWP